MTEKIFSISDNPEPKNLMTEEQRRSISVLERGEAEKEDLSATELKLDGTNKVSFPGFPYKFEAAGEKIIVSIDIFKSGYECKVCKGLKRKEVRCACEDRGRPGFQYSESDIEVLKDTKGDKVAEARFLMSCPDCKGDYPAYRRIETCPACHGRGATIILPDSSKNLPTTGVVVSMGPDTSSGWREINGKAPLSYGIGDRILFGPYAGNMVPTKAGILFKILDADNAWCVIEGADDLGQFDFVLQDTEAQ